MEGDFEVHSVMEAGELGLDRNSATDRLVFAFARFAEARIAKWIQFPKGVLLFLTVPGDGESGWFYLLDRRRRMFFRLDITRVGRYGGFREDEFESLADEYGLKKLAARPRELTRWIPAGVLTDSRRRVM
jgi:hypothetical protein